MTTKINPPVLKGKEYELYKQELLAWREVTDLEKSKMGVAIALTLPEDDANNIREKVFNQMELEDLKKDDGLDMLIRFLDKHLAKDDLTDSLEKFEEFEDFKRSPDQSIIEYVSVFDANYRKIEKKGMNLPPFILAFKLLRMANISKEEKMLVLTGMHYENKEELYEEAKRSLKKFKSEAVLEKSSGSETTIKLEPAFLAQNEEALLAAGYTKIKQPNQYRRGRSGFRGGYNSSKGHQKGRAPTTYNQMNTSNVKKINSTGSDGRLLTCSSCGSFRHMLQDCPDSWENMGKVNISEEEEHAVLFTGKTEFSQLGLEARQCGVLDSACSSTVCGRNWMEDYLSSLDSKTRQKVEQSKGVKVFKFGGGEKLKSEGQFIIPAVIAGKDISIKTDVVSSDIPLLLARSAMKAAGVKMDLENDTAIIFGKEVFLNLTSSGHYCIPIDRNETISVESVCSVKLNELSKDQQHAKLLKLHRQFAHPPKSRLISFLQDAGVWNNEYLEILNDIQNNCQLCKVYAKTPPRPPVSMPMAKFFNEKVCMDLKKWNDTWILHMIGMWSRYTISVFISRKRPADVIDVLMKHWVGVYGIMGSIMTDNGGEFSSEEMREVASILNIKVHTTAGESPFQNGLCERVHSITDSMLIKLEAEHKNIDKQTLLSWANMARNSLQMYNGFSSHQLVFGHSPNLPNIMTDTPPSIQASTTSETFAKHLNALHASRKSYIEQEASERIRRALRTKLRASEQVFRNGEMVYYKREGKDRWLGPGRVVFQDGKVIFVRHGGVFVRVSPNRLIKVGDNYVNSKDEDIINEVKAKNTKREDTIVSEQCPKKNTTESNIPTKSSQQTLKVNDRIRYKDKDQWISATIIGRAGKSTGKYNSWYNIKNTQDEKSSIDLSCVQWEKTTEEENTERENNEGDISTDNVDSEDEVNINSISCEDELKIGVAKQQELDKLNQFDTYTEVPDSGQNTISTRWVITRKDNKYKARLVVRGFEETYLLPRDSPTINKGSIRVFLTIGAINNWIIKTTDIKSAFLQGKELERDIYLRPPAEYKGEQNCLWKLKHTLYGLKDGARQFYLSVKEELLKLGFKQCALDPAMFFLQCENKLCGVICCHEDDFLHAGDAYFEKSIVQLGTRFTAGKIEEKSFKYIGFQICQSDNKIIMDHSEYVCKLPSIIIDPTRASEKTREMNSEEQTLFRQLFEN